MSLIKTASQIVALSMQAFREQNPEGSSGTSTAAAPAPTPAPVVIPEGMKGQMFHFRKEKVKVGEGEEIEVYKHPSIIVPLPIPTVDQLKEIFNAPTTGDNNRSVEQKYILDLVFDGFYSQVREQINATREEGSKTAFSVDNVDYSKLSILALASMPASERGSKVTDEDMAEFIKDYVSIMPAASGKDISKIKAQAGILEKGLRTVRTDKQVLDIMSKLLTLWAGTTANMEEHQEVYEMLTGRIKKWLATEPKNVLDSIM